MTWFLVLVNIKNKYINSFKYIYPWMKTSDFVACTGIHKKLVHELNNATPVILVIGGPGCGKTSFIQHVFMERHYNVLDISQIQDAETVCITIKGFCSKGKIDELIRQEKKTKRAVWLDDNVAMGATAAECCLKSGIQMLATSTSRQISRYAQFRRKCTILKMNYPSKQKCLKHLCESYPNMNQLEIQKVVVGVNCSIPRARLAIEHFGFSDYICDLRKMDMTIYDTASSVLRLAKSYEDVREMTLCEPVMLSIIMQETTHSPQALRNLHSTLGIGMTNLAEIACYSGYLYGNKRRKPVFPRCYTLASARQAAIKRVETFCSQYNIVSWEMSWMYTSKFI